MRIIKDHSNAHWPSDALVTDSAGLTASFNGQIGDEGAVRVVLIGSYTPKGKRARSQEWVLDVQEARVLVKRLQDLLVSHENLKEILRTGSL